MTAVIRTRYVLAAVIFLGYLATSCMQNNMNVAIVAMVNKTLWETKTLMSDECLPPSLLANSSKHDVRSASGEFFWEPKTQGHLLGANSYATLFSHIFGGYLAVRYGGKWVFGWGMLVGAVFSILTPPAAYLGVSVLFAVRFMFGLAEGVIYPAAITLISSWAPEKERSSFIALLLSGLFVGSATISVATGYLSSSNFLGGWPSVFYLSGILGVIGFLLTVFFIYDSPENHPGISKEELDYIIGARGTHMQKGKLHLVSVLRSLPFWSIITYQFVHAWFATVFNTAMPLYLETTQRLPIQMTGLFVGMIYPANICGSLLGGIIADLIRKKTQMRISTLRKLFSAFACLGGSFCFILIPFAGCNKSILFALMFLTKLIMCMNTGGCFPVLVDMAPQHAGVLTGFSGTLTGSTGFLVPLVTGTITNTDVTIEQWSCVFFVAVTVYVIGLFVFLLFGSAEIQPWASCDKSIEIEERASLVKSFDASSGNYIAGVARATP